MKTAYLGISYNSNSKEQYIAASCKALLESDHNFDTVEIIILPPSIHQFSVLSRKCHKDRGAAYDEAAASEGQWRRYCDRVKNDMDRVSVFDGSGFFKGEEYDAALAALRAAAPEQPADLTLCTEDDPRFENRRWLEAKVRVVVTDATPEQMRNSIEYILREGAFFMCLSRSSRRTQGAFHFAYATDFHFFEFFSKVDNIAMAEFVSFMSCLEL
eukprot:TRINITY_DN4214_c3_g1_i1.p1 TRINITY_DN4214_c3_g1~~TRINITY_DN4214_c3_g1_i1.p1  ORF type:complete len:230 (-),score=50.34 TRINITY_DN4214_c3_g1_i1:89-730(-)